MDETTARIWDIIREEVIGGVGREMRYIIPAMAHGSARDRLCGRANKEGLGL